MKRKLLLILTLSIFFISYQSYAQDTDGDGTTNNLDQDEDNDGVPDELDGCSVIDIANTIGIGSPIVNNSTYSIVETNITYTTNNANAFYGYVAGNQGDAIRVQGPGLSNAQLQTSFSTPVQNLTFKITDFDDNEEVTVNAYDENNNLINLSATNVPFLGSFVARSGNLIQATSTGTNSAGDDVAGDVTGATYFYFPNEVSRIVFVVDIQFDSSLRFTEFNYCLKDTDNDGILDFLDIDSDNDGIPDTVESGGVDTDGDGYVDNITDNNGNGIPDIYDFSCTNGVTGTGYATMLDNNDTNNTTNPSNALNAGDQNYASINSGGTLALRFVDLIPAGNNIVIRHTRQSGSTPISFSVERSQNGATYSNAQTFTTSFNDSYEVLSYDLIGGDTRYIKITNLSTETLGVDYAKYNFGANSNCSGINGQQILNLDTDNDGLTNAQDLDSDGDGIFDIIEATSIDTDGDGLADGFIDSDGDGYNDNFDGDVGNDGIAENTASALISTGVDTDSDGIPNSYNNANPDNSGFPNPFDIDADNDGIPDNVEAQLTAGYIVPAAGINANGINDAYPSSLTLTDTDGDGIFDYLDSDSDNDGTPDIQENGDADVLNGSDSDLDGLDNNFDSNNVLFDVNDEVTVGTIADLTASFGDLDGDTALGGDLDYRDVFDINPPSSATIDFDGVDDYIDSEPILGSLSNATIMAWVKLDGSFNKDGFVAGQDNFLLYIKYGASNTNKLVAIANGVSTEVSTVDIDIDKWVHLAAVYSNGDLKIYLNGEEEANPSLSGALNTSTNNFSIGKYPELFPTVSNPDAGQYFKGAIDEVRVFDAALTEDQLQQIIFQEIEQNSSLVNGIIIPKGVKDFTSSATLPWANLQAYYPMTDIITGRTLDFSIYGRIAVLHNITLVQPQTAPMPYETKAGGDGLWSSTNNWLNGDVWDIENPLDVKPWAIFNIKHNISNDSGVKSYGLIINDGATLTINGDNEVNNEWYLELNGAIDLNNDSQLIQSINSDLVTEVNGKILRRQEGNLNYFWYNYWSSPVGSPTVTNNTNTDFTINMLKDDSGNLVTFTATFDNTGDISTRWLYKFQNGITYNDWATLTPNTNIAPGVGFTHKGTNNANGDLQYIFDGKPNNGTILLVGDDVDNDNLGIGESVQDVTLTTYLVGNPYPSALDAREFINDNTPTNGGVTSGTIFVWEQWAGNNHLLEEYQGGYATINMASTAPAYQWNDATTQSVTLPTFYIPVAQGFFVEIVEDGDIKFDNSQRIFIKEADADGSNPNNGSVFFRTTESSTSNQTNDEQIGIIRLNLNVSNGNQRNFVLAFSDFTTDSFDYGYDSRTIDPQGDDMSSYLDNEKMVIQSFAPITNDKVVDLVFNSTGAFNYTIEMSEISNIPEDQEVFLRDNLTNTYFDLRIGAYSFSSDFDGEDTERFDLVFQSGDTLSNEAFLNDNTLIFVNNLENTLYVKNLSTLAKKLSITNVLGQTINTYNYVSIQTLKNGLNISNLSTGMYVVSIQTENNQSIDKKIIVK